MPNSAVYVQCAFCPFPMCLNGFVVIQVVNLGLSLCLETVKLPSISSHCGATLETENGRNPFKRTYGNRKGVAHGRGFEPPNYRLVGDCCLQAKLSMHYIFLTMLLASWTSSVTDEVRFLNSCASTMSLTRLRLNPMASANLVITPSLSLPCPLCGVPKLKEKPARK